MKRLNLLFFLFPHILTAQWCLNFENIGLEGCIQGRDSAWEITPVEAISGQYSLHHYLDDTVSNHDVIAWLFDSLVIEDMATQWQFRIRHSYNPSSSNRWAVYLAAEGDPRHMQTGEISSAWITGVNFQGSDDLLKLWKLEKGMLSTVVTTSLNWQEEIGPEAAALRISRTAGGRWKINREPDEHHESEIEIGEGQDSARIRPDFCGIDYRYSSRQDRKLWFDDFCVTGRWIRDTIPPSIREILVLDSNRICLYFTETVDQECMSDPIQYTLGSVGIHPDTLIWLDAQKIELRFAESFSSGLISNLNIGALVDPRGNATHNFKVQFLFYHPQQGDVIINEIMYDPDPAIELPEYEYLELFNRTAFDINLEDWILRVGERDVVFPGHIIKGEKYLLLAYPGTSGTYPESINILESMPSRTFLSNVGDTLYLYDSEQSLMDWVIYMPEMHGDPYYREGGWSLEKIDPDRPCYNIENWENSVNRTGGSPGRQNSIFRSNPDFVQPSIEEFFPPDSQSLTIIFSEIMQAGGLKGLSNYRIRNENIHPVKATIIAPFNRELKLEWSRPFLMGREYQFEISGSLFDCTGLELSSVNDLRFALPVLPSVDDLLISEVLFHPGPGCPEFVEIFNPSSHTFDLSDIRIACRDPATGTFQKVTRLVDRSRLIFPSDYIVLSKDPGTLVDFYLPDNPSAFIKVSQMPSLDDRQGTILILDKWLNIIDEMRYDEDMHFPLLAREEGVSLERLSYELATADPSNWHSASVSEGSATPGRMNSMNAELEHDRSTISVEPEIFSPDQDGINDICIIKYRFDRPGCVVSVLIFDPWGRIIHRITENNLVGMEGFFTWDGTNLYGRLSRSGLYLIFVEVFDLKGQVSRYKKTCVLSPGR